MRKIPYFVITWVTLNGGDGRLAKGMEKLAVAFKHEPQVGDTILEHGESFNPRAKRKCWKLCKGLWCADVWAICHDVAVGHAAAQHL